MLVTAHDSKNPRVAARPAHGVSISYKVRRLLRLASLRSAFWKPHLGHDRHLAEVGASAKTNFRFRGTRWMSIAFHIRPSSIATASIVSSRVQAFACTRKDNSIDLESAT